jgi:single-stranded-DNA-specific exonuclease
MTKPGLQVHFRFLISGVLAPATGEGLQAGEIRRFSLRETAPEEPVRSLAEQLGIPAPVVAIGWQRGLQNLQAWTDLQGSDPLTQHDPFLLIDMDLAVDRLLFARDNNQRILIHGDYDVDGLTGTALLTRALKWLGMDVRPFVPHREKDGYGLSRRALENAVDNGCSLVITVDCGSSSGELIEEMAQRGLETVVTDHHLFDEKPAPLAFINPRRPESPYPFTPLSGSAVAYKLARGVHEALERPLDGDLLLDHVALGTVADVMPLEGENRLLVKAGLRELSRLMTVRTGSTADICPAWRALGRTSKLQPGELQAEDLAFRLAPRLNSPGRLAGAKLSLDLLLAKTASQANLLASQIETINESRRDLEARVTERARLAAQGRIARAMATGGPPGILALVGRDWHPGVLGISASRLVDQYACPVLLAGMDEAGEARGSGRSLEGVDLKALLDQAAEPLARYGGHKRAVGFTVKSGCWDEFARLVEKAAGAVGEISTPQITADLCVEAEQLVRPFLDGLELLGPFGEGNPVPIFLVREVIPRSFRIIKGSHLKVQFESRDGRPFSAIAFGQAAEMKGRVEVGAATDICLRLARDTFRRPAGDHDVSFHLVNLFPAGVS